MYFFKKETTVLKEQTRIIEDVVVTLRIVRERTKILGGLLQFASKSVVSEYKASQVPLYSYPFQMGLKAAEFDILHNEYKLMTQHCADDWD